MIQNKYNFTFLKSINFRAFEAIAAEWPTYWKKKIIDGKYIYKQEGFSYTWNDMSIWYNLIRITNVNVIFNKFKDVFL